MLRRPPRATRTAPLFPYTTLFRSDRGVVATRQRRSRQTPPQSPPSEEEWALSSARHVAIIMDGNGRWARQRALPRAVGHRSEEHTSELPSLMRISYAVFCLKKKKQNYNIQSNQISVTQTHLL